MAAIDQYRAALDAGAKAANAVGVRLTTVVVTIETWTKPINTLGATLVTSVNTTLSPPPRVRFKSDNGQSFWGGGPRADATGGITARQYDVGPIAQTFYSSTSGGYSAASLMPALTSPANRVYLTLSGPDFQAGGEKFKVISFNSSKALAIRLVVERTEQ